MADFRVIVPLDRDAAAKRLARKRARRVAEHVSAELRHAASGLRDTCSLPIELALADLLAAVATDMDDYLDTRAQATGTTADHPVWQSALALARLINPKETPNA